jgi:AmmeMemoRadiSam system protein B
MRSPVVAGPNRFYEASPDKLVRQIENCYKHKLGPGKLPVLSKTPKRKIKGLVVPHAGFRYSGPVAAHSYYSLATDGFPETFIVLGPNHSGFGNIVALTTEDFQMPLGNIMIDQELAKSIWTGIIDNDLNAHKYEHSIEVQLPFLQHINKNFKFIPISLAMQDFNTASEVGEIIAKAIKKSGRDVVIIASSDFTHCGPSYGAIPKSGMSAGDFAKSQDEKAINAILSMDPKSLFKNVMQFNISMCGKGPVIAMMVTAKELGASKSTLLQYASSYDIEPSQNAVGYAAIKIE